MSPQVEAALIAGSVGVITLIGTLAAQFYGIRRTSKDTLNARFATAADKLGSEAPAVRLAGVYAMAGLADDWPENRWQDFSSTTSARRCSGVRVCSRAQAISPAARGPYARPLPVSGVLRSDPF